MSIENRKKTRKSDSEVERIPWREFVRSQFRKIAAFLLLLVLLFVIIGLSGQISPNSEQINPDGVLELSTATHIYLMILSSLLFIIVLAAFTKVVLLDHQEEFGITHWKQRRVLVTFLLTTSFISLVYILLDISLINIYLMTLPTWVVWVMQFNIPNLDPLVPDTVDRLAYSTIRGYIFVLLLGFMFIFPLTMFISILTRYGRTTIKEQREKERKLPASRLFLGLVAAMIFTGGSYLGFTAISNDIISAIFLFLSIGFLLAAVVFGLLLIIHLLRFTVIFTYSNLLLIFPFIFLFYLLPGGLWGLWDLIVIVTTGGIDNTIYSNLRITPAIDPATTDIGSLGSFDLVRFYMQTVYFNLQPVAFFRIIQLDFIIVVGLSALVIGFAEGYSILAIFRSISKGVSIARTGRVATRSAPRIIVLTSRLFYLVAWLSFFWDNIITISSAISTTINISIPLVELPSVLGLVIGISFNLSGVSDYLLVFAILAVPFYFILTSAFKFLSVSLALERVQDDRQVYYLLISSAFILIVTNIFADIAALPQFIGAHKPFLPLQGAATENLLPFVAKIFDFLEALGFYAGVIVSIGISIKRYMAKRQKISDTEDSILKQDRKQTELTEEVTPETSEISETTEKESDNPVDGIDQQEIVDNNFPESDNSSQDNTDIADNEKQE